MLLFFNSIAGMLHYTFFLLQGEIQIRVLEKELIDIAM